MSPLPFAAAARLKVSPKTLQRGATRSRYRNVRGQAKDGTVRAVATGFTSEAELTRLVRDTLR